MKILLSSAIALTLLTAGVGCDGTAATPIDSVQPDRQGLITATVMISAVQNVQTIGVRAIVDGANVVEWSRSETFLRSAGGNEVLLESKLVENELRIIAGTTAPVSLSGEQVLLTLVLEPTSDNPTVRVLTDGSDLGLINPAGQRITDATFRVDYQPNS